MLTTCLSAGIPILDGIFFNTRTFFIIATQLRFSMVQSTVYFLIYMFYSVNNSCELNCKSDRHVRSARAFIIVHVNSLSVAVTLLG